MAVSGCKMGSDQGRCWRHKVKGWAAGLVRFERVWRRTMPEPVQGALLCLMSSSSSTGLVLRRTLWTSLRGTSRRAPLRGALGPTQLKSRRRELSTASGLMLASISEPYC